MSHPHHPTLLHKRLPYFGRGLVRNGLVAEYWFDECRNLLKYSQQFDNAVWGKADGVVVTPNQTTAPDGTMTADTILLPDLNKNSGCSVPVAPNTVYTWSIYRKKGPQGTTVTDFIYDITHSGVITGTYKNRALSDTWERHTTTFTTPEGCTNVYLYIGYNSTAYPVEYHAWGAQLEAGSAARTYYPTTDKQLLMDTSRPRKNLLLPNQANCCEDGTTTGFWGYTNEAISASTAQKWQGAYSLKCITPNAAASEGITTNAYPTYGLRPGATYTTSVYLRGDAGGETVKLYLFELTDANGEVGSSNSDTITLTTEWQRVTVSRTFGATGRGALITVITTTQQAATFYVDGLQLEEGSTATDWEAPPNIGICCSTTGADTNDPAWHPLGLSFDGVDDVITGQPSATDVYTYMGDGVYGIGRVRGHRAKNGGKAVCDLRYNRLLTTAEKTRNLQYVSSLARRRGFTGTVYKEAFPIPCTAGLMDVSITGAPVLWVFPDGTTSTASRPAKTLEVNGTVWVYCSDWLDSDLTINDNGTDSRYVGDLKDLPPSLTYYLNLNNCSLVTGDLADLPKLTYYLNLRKCSLITGDLADLPKLTYYLNLYNCPLVTGILSPTAGLKTIDLRGTGMSANDTDQTLINLAAVTTRTSGTIQTKGNRTAASDAAVATLRAKSWKVDGS